MTSSRGRKRTAAPADGAPQPAVRLRFSSDAKPGIHRVRHGDTFRFTNPDGSPIHDETEIARLRSLAIPPAWTNVWICPYPNGHIQATGRDARGRKQYRYHAAFRDDRDEEKYLRIVIFGRSLPKLRKQVDRDLRRHGLERERVLATVVRLLETTSMRIGNPQYVRENRSYGLTTLRTRHADVDGSHIRFRFRGKSGLQHDVDVRDRRLASIVARIQDLPGQELFQYLDDAGEPRAVESDDVNAYLKTASGADVTAKDFRTWAGTLLAFRVLRSSSTKGSSTSAKRTVRESTELVAEALGNTPAVSRASYIAPRVVDAYLSGDLPQALVHAGEAAGHLSATAKRREELALIRTLDGTVGKGAGRRTRHQGR